MDGEKIGRDEFLQLPAEQVRRWVLQKNKPHTGIFVADGNRRLVMTQTGLTPASKDFYPAYLEIVTGFFMKNLAVFFNHGLNTLLFPLFGTSLLDRCDSYRQVVMPGLIRLLFQNEKWLCFYRENAVRVKTYGNMEILDREFPGLGLADIVRQTEIQTSNNEKHTLFYGFFSSMIPGMNLIREAHRLMESYNRELTQAEWTQLYYGEPVAPADFFITSTCIGYLGALPPWGYGKNTQMYTLPVPGILGLNERTYRDILYDLLFLRQTSPANKMDGIEAKDIEYLKNFYRENRDKVVGTGRKVGKCWLPNT